MANILYYKTGLDLEYERSYLSGKKDCDVRLYAVEKTSEVSLIEAANEFKADGIVVIFEEVSRHAMERIPTLKIVSIPSIGYNNIDINAAKELGIRVTNVSSYCEEEVAEHTVGMALNLARKISYLDREVRGGKWSFSSGYVPHRLRGKVFGMVYFGKIPKCMISMLKGFGLEILVFAPTKTGEEIEAFGCKKADTLEQLLKESDFVSMHTPLCGETFHMIGEKEFSHMKPTAFFINTARGSVVDEMALYTAVKTGKIAGAAVDVIEDEKYAKTRLTELPNVIITPHAAFYSEESLVESRQKALQHVIDLCCLKKETEDIVV